MSPNKADLNLNTELIPEVIQLLNSEIQSVEVSPMQVQNQNQVQMTDAKRRESTEVYHCTIENVRTKWEIKVDKTRTYYTIERKVLVPDYGEDWEILEICNHNKEWGKEAKLLVRWNSGQREWSYISNVMIDDKDKVISYVENNQLNWNTLGYNYIPENVETEVSETSNDNNNTEGSNNAEVANTNEAEVTNNNEAEITKNYEAEVTKNFEAEVTKNNEAEVTKNNNDAEVSNNDAEVSNKNAEVTDKGAEVTNNDDNGKEVINNVEEATLDKLNE